MLATKLLLLTSPPHTHLHTHTHTHTTHKEKRRWFGGDLGLRQPNHNLKVNLHACVRLGEKGQHTKLHSYRTHTYTYTKGQGLELQGAGLTLLRQSLMKFNSDVTVSQQGLALQGGPCAGPRAAGSYRAGFCVLCMVVRRWRELSPTCSCRQQYWCAWD